MQILHRVTVRIDTRTVEVGVLSMTAQGRAAASQVFIYGGLPLPQALWGR